MDPFLTFLMEHWLLSTTFVIIVVLFAINEWRHHAFGIPGIAIQQLVDFLNHEEATVVDIRSQALYQRGHILGAINIPKEDFSQPLTTFDKYKNKPFILVCAVGTDSPKIGRMLKTQGFNQIYFLTGGMESWHGQSMPVVKGAANN